MYSNVTPSTIIISVALTFMVYLVHQIILAYRKVTPYKKDKQANQSLIYIHAIGKEYFTRIQPFGGVKHGDFNIRLMQLREVFDLQRMQNKEYRLLLKPVLKKHHEVLTETYSRYLGLKNAKELSIRDIENVIESTNTVVNTLIIDINLIFEPSTNKQ